jgi:hypothetical protein
MDIMSQFNLPSYLKGKSFSDASAIIAKKFEGRNTPEDVATLNELQGRLQDAQEFVKAKKEERSKPQGSEEPMHQMPDGSMMPGEQHQGGPEQAQVDPAALQSMMQGMEQQPQQPQNEFKKGGNMYAAGGAMGSPGMWGQAFEGINQLMSNENQYRDRPVLNSRNDIESTNLDSSGIEFDGLSSFGDGAKALDGIQTGEAPKAITENTSSGSDGTNGSDSKFNPAELLRYAAPATTAYQLATLKKPEEVALARSNRKYDEQYVDERGIQNTVANSAANTRAGVMNASGGSASAARANLLASQVQEQTAQSQAYSAATAENRNENRQGQQFDSGIDALNIQQSNSENQMNLARQAGYDSNKSKLISQLGSDVSGIGQEELFKRYPELAGLGYDSKGRKIKSKTT